jgi:hypothetical protein
MSGGESKELAKELCKRWPQKFNADDLELWGRELDGYQLSDVVRALTKYKNENRYVPKIHEIKLLLPALPVVASAAKVDATRYDHRDDTAADMIRSTHPWLARETSDAAVHLRYWRSIWMTWGGRWIKQIETMASDACFVPVKARLQERIDALRTRCQRECANSLWYLMPEDRAQRCIAFIFESPEMFRMLLEELRVDEAFAGDSQTVAVDAERAVENVFGSVGRVDSTPWNQMTALAKAEYGQPEVSG